MLYVLLGIVVTGVIGFILASEFENDFLLFIGVLLMLAASMCSLAYTVLVWEWIASEHKTTIINREYGTSYTREEVFFASDVIDTIREINRQRVEVNGDMFREKPGSKDGE